MNRHTTVLLLVLLVSACAPFPVSRDGYPVERESAGTIPEDGAAGALSSPSTALLEQARSHLAAAEYSAAAASLERAIRIEPGNAWLWLELARVHQASGNLQQAQAHARKAASLAGSDGAARRSADRLLEDIAKP